ncbi:hypothetical protein CR513_33509, partial [Mucuna pruriens]
MAPSAKLDASHINSNGSSQFGACRIGVDVNLVFSSSKASMHASLKTKSTSFCSRLDRGKKPACPKKKRTSRTKAGTRDRFSKHASKVSVYTVKSSIKASMHSSNRSKNFGDLEPIGMTIQLANRSVVQPSGVLKDVLVQVNKLIFPADFYVLDMEDEISGKGSTLILGRLFLMTSRTKIDVHVGTLSMEFGDTLVQFNIFEAMKYPTEDHSLFGIDLIDELVKECLQLDSSSEDISNFAGETSAFDCLGSITKEANYDELCEVHNLSDSEDDNIILADLSQETKLLKLSDQVCNHENLECLNKVDVQVTETKMLFPAEVATMFRTEYESTRGGQDRENNSAKKTSVEADPPCHIQAKTISSSEDQKQARAESVSNN